MHKFTNQNLSLCKGHGIIAMFMFNAKNATQRMERGVFMKKKILALAMTLALVLFFSACGKMVKSG
ncbi:MAG: hypothetical protein K2K10_10205, partial [Acetatifactor sp.]|nr:hypothetical protein [Acetatifactor sp.]